MPIYLNIEYLVGEKIYFLFACQLTRLYSYENMEINKTTSNFKL